MTQQEQRSCYTCGGPADDDNAFHLPALSLLRSTREDQRKVLETCWEREGLTERLFVHTACIQLPEGLDRPLESAFQAWALARINKLERQMNALHYHNEGDAATWPSRPSKTCSWRPAPSCAETAARSSAPER